MSVSAVNMFRRNCSAIFKFLAPHADPRKLKYSYTEIMGRI